MHFNERRDWAEKFLVWLPRRVSECNSCPSVVDCDMVMIGQVHADLDLTEFALC